jgi:ribosomal protein S18 acetylase RimI-like enzyme
MNLKLVEHKKSNIFYLWFTYQKAMKGHIENIWGWDDEWQINDFNKSLKTYKSFLITLDSELVGYVQFKDNNTSIYINMLILEPQYQGLGKKLLGLLMQDYSGRGIELKCFKINTSAYNFYLSNGFEVTDEDENFYFLSKIER